MKVLKKKETKDNTKEVLSMEKRDFNSIIEKSHRIQENCRDFIVSKPMTYEYDTRQRHQIYYSPNNVNEVYTSPSSDFAMSQLCTKIGVPFQYINKCTETGRYDLAESNINSWLENCNKNFLIREYKGKIRGILSTRYSVFDTPQILENVSDVIPLEQYNIKGYFLNEERFHLRLVSKEQLPVKEDLFHGITIDSSDVGRSNLSINFIIWKQVCTNGLIIPKKFGMLYQQKHLGISSDEMRRDIGKSLDLIEPLIAKVTMSIQNTKNVSLGDVFYDDLKLENFINDVRKTAELPREGVNKVIELMRNGTYPQNQWGLINSLTEVAQDYTLETRLRIERVAGNLLIA